jgi:hypothetical protein
MSPDVARQQLRDQLTEHGEDIVLKRRVGTGMAFDAVMLRATVRGYTPQELTGGITQQDSKLVCGVEEIEAAGWPPSAGGPAFPRRGDFVLIGGVQKAVEATAPVRINGVIVRIDMQVRG